MNAQSMVNTGHLQVTLSGNRDEGVQQYRGLLDPSLLDQPLPRAQKPATYDEEVQGGSPQGEVLVVIHTMRLCHADSGCTASMELAHIIASMPRPRWE